MNKIIDSNYYQTLSAIGDLLIDKTKTKYENVIGKGFASNRKRVAGSF